MLQVLLGQCMSDVLKLLRVVSASDETMQTMFIEEQRSSPPVLSSGHTTAMGITLAGTPTSATIGNAGTTEEHIQVSHSHTVS